MFKEMEMLAAFIWLLQIAQNYLTVTRYNLTIHFKWISLLYVHKRKNGKILINI